MERPGLSDRTAVSFLFGLDLVFYHSEKDEAHSPDETVGDDGSQDPDRTEVSSRSLERKPREPGADRAEEREEEKFTLSRTEAFDGPDEAEQGEEHEREKAEDRSRKRRRRGGGGGQ